MRKGAAVLAAVFALAVFAYRATGEYSWIEAIWMVVVTISTVGYGESSGQTMSVQIVSVLVILFGVTAGAYTFGGLVQMMLQGELERALGVKKMTREIGRLNDHVIICGFGRLGQDLAEQLTHRRVSYVVIDTEESKFAESDSENQLSLVGDATDEDVLQDAGITKARAIVTGLPSDAENVFIALTARNLCPNIQIISKAEEESSCRKLRQAGANNIVMPHRVGAQQMERMISRPTTADLIELFAEASHLDMELDEISVPANSRLVGREVKESKMKEEFGVLLVGIKNPAGEFQFNPDADHQICENDMLLVMGQVDEIQRLRDSLN
jgi:voltage-gated potassium channel